MVKVKEGTPLQPDGSIDVQLWLNEVSSKGYFQDLDLIKFTKSENYLRFNETDYLGFRARAERVIHQWTHPEPIVELSNSGGHK